MNSRGKINFIALLLVALTMGITVASAAPITLIDKTFDGVANDTGPSWEGAGWAGTSGGDPVTGEVTLETFGNNMRANLNTASTVDVSAASSFTMTWDINPGGTNFVTENDTTGVWHGGLFFGVTKDTDPIAGGFENADFAFGVNLVKGTESAGWAVVDANNSGGNTYLWHALDGSAPTQASMEDGFTLSITLNDDNTYEVSTTGLSNTATSTGSLSGTKASYSSLATSLRAYTSVGGGGVTYTVNQATLTAIPLPILEWIGGSSTDWTDSANWSGDWGADGTGNTMNIGKELADTGGDISLNSAFNSANSVSVGEAVESSLTIGSAGALTVDSGVTVGTEGTLTVNGTLSAGSVAVAGTLNGNGTITGTVTVTGNAAPGNSIGEITVENGPATFVAGSTYDWEFDGSSADLIAITGTPGNLVFDNSGGTFTINALPLNGGGFDVTNATYNLFSFTGSLLDEDLITVITAGNLGNYITLNRFNSEKWTVDGDLAIVDLGGGITAIQLQNFTYVPEPSTIVLAGLGLAGLTLRRRRRSA